MVRKANDVPDGILAVDPGAKGGYAIFDNVGQDKFALTIYDRIPLQGGTALIDCEKLFWKDLSGCDVAVIEQVGSMPGNSGRTMFEFGKSVGQIIGICLSHGMQIESLSPLAWQNIAHKGQLRSTSSKQRSFMAVEDMFDIRLAKTNDGIADAICIGIAYILKNKWKIKVEDVIYG